jgi:hypothetical protein
VYVSVGVTSSSYPPPGAGLASGAGAASSGAGSASAGAGSASAGAGAACSGAGTTSPCAGSTPGDATGADAGSASGSAGCAASSGTASSTTAVVVSAGSASSATAPPAANGAITSDTANAAPVMTSHFSFMAFPSGYPGSPQGCLREGSAAGVAAGTAAQHHFTAAEKRRTEQGRGAFESRQLRRRVPPVITPVAPTPSPGQKTQSARRLHRDAPMVGRVSALRSVRQTHGRTGSARCGRRPMHVHRDACSGCGSPPHPEHDAAEI